MAEAALILAAVAVLTSGTVAGALFAVARAVGPAMRELPGTTYVRLHQLLDPHFDPFMPRVTMLTLAAAPVAAVLTDSIAARALFAAGFIATVTVAVVSQTGTVRINRDIHTWNLAALPAQWSQVRENWLRANVIRTVFAVTAFASYTAGMLA
jgi:uncharacterized membrane protein